jgi:glutaredoxin
MVKKFLDMKGKAYDVVDISENPALRQKLYDETGALTVPITKIGAQYIVGWQPAKLATALS